MVPDQPIRIAIAGLGDIARKVYLPLLSQLRRVEIAGVLSSSPATVERTVQQYRLPRGTVSLEEMLDWEIDAVFIHSPTPVHYDMVMKCLERGKAVYVDKPLSYRLEESAEMAQSAEEKGLLLAVGFNRRFAPLYLQAREWVEQAGRPGFLTAYKHRTGLQPLTARETVHDDLIHMLDLLLWLGGDEAALEGARLLRDGEGRLLRVSGSLEWQGALGQFGMARDSGADAERLELHGEGRSAIVQDMEQAILQEKSRPARTLGCGSWDTLLDRRGFSGAVAHFLDHIGQPSGCSIGAGRVLTAHKLADRLSRG
ncbi:Gfo/Idh/MocA family protein [Paenibacillus glufosinatiresistens]|uniref:Gfo/Idh/MocA family protein n=1 Tax=Paenibacillus glufosinatiresistens TaxID=3070657 RepID=UPI00286E7154|nr:Gfo/Idh/MocA family oxidoreductase [Paenibacillus sp. YX.27]